MSNSEIFLFVLILRKIYHPQALGCDSQCLQLGPYFRHWSLIGTFWGKSENLVPIWSLFYQFGPYSLKNWRNTRDLTQKWPHFVPQENFGGKVR